MIRKGKSSNKKKVEQMSRPWRKKRASEMLNRDFSMPFFGPDDVNLNSTTSGSVIVSSGGIIQSFQDDLFGVVYVYGNAKLQDKEAGQDSGAVKPANIVGNRPATRKFPPRGSAVGPRGKH
jgi:hypothetical protein